MPKSNDNNSVKQLPGGAENYVSVQEEEQASLNGSEYIKKYRKGAGLTQEAFCSKFSIKVGTLRQWEQGVYPPPAYLIHMLEEREELLKRIAEKDRRISDLEAYIRLGSYFETLKNRNTDHEDK